MKVTKTMYTETAHRLVGHPGACKNLHGHSYKWEVTLYSPHLNPDGMIEDFSNLKEVMNEVIMDQFDHCTVLENCAENKPLINAIISMEMKLTLINMPPTAENYCNFVKTFIAKKYPLFDIAVACWETTTSKAEA